MEHNSGVYQITNKVNGHCYIGSSKNLDGRLSGHFKTMINGGGSNIILKRAGIKYGVDNFEFTVLLYCTPEHCTMYEQMVMDKFKPEYNICKIAGSNLGMKMSEESKQKMSKSMKGNTNCVGRKHSEETKEKLRVWNTGRKMSESAKCKLSKSLTGRKLSEDHRRKTINALKGNTYRLGKKLSEEHRQKISEANKGKNNPFYGKKHSEETRRKMRGPRKKHIEV